MSFFISCLTQLEDDDEMSQVRVDIDDRLCGLSEVIADESMLKMFHRGKTPQLFESSKLSSPQFFRLIGAIRDRGWVISSSNCRNIDNKGHAEGPNVERKFYLEKRKGDG